MTSPAAVPNPEDSSPKNESDYQDQRDEATQLSRVTHPRDSHVLSVNVQSAAKDTFKGRDTGLIIGQIITDPQIVAELAAVPPFEFQNNPTQAVQQAWSDLESGSPEQALLAANNLGFAFKNVMTKAGLADTDPEESKETLLRASVYLVMLANLVMEKASKSDRFAILFESLDNLIGLFDEKLGDAVKELRQGNEQLSKSKFDYLFKYLVDQAEKSMQQPEGQVGPSALQGVLLFRVIVSTLERLSPDDPVASLIFKRFATQFTGEIEQVRLASDTANSMALVALVDQAGEMGGRFFRTARNVFSSSTISEDSAVRRKSSRDAVSLHINPEDAEALFSAACLMSRVQIFDDLKGLVQSDTLPLSIRLNYLSALKFGIRGEGDDQEEVADLMAERLNTVISEGLKLLEQGDQKIVSGVIKKVLYPLAAHTTEYLCEDNQLVYKELRSELREALLARVVQPHIVEADSVQPEVRHFFLYEIEQRTSVAKHEHAIEVFLSDQLFRSYEEDEQVLIRKHLVASFEPSSVGVTSEKVEAALIKFGMSAVKDLLEYAATLDGKEKAQGLYGLVGKIARDTTQEISEADAELLQRTLSATILPRFTQHAGERAKKAGGVANLAAKLKEITSAIVTASQTIEKERGHIEKIKTNPEFRDYAIEYADQNRLKTKNLEKAAEFDNNGDILERNKAKTAADLASRQMEEIRRQSIGSLGMTMGECLKQITNFEQALKLLDARELAKVDLESKYSMQQQTFAGIREHLVPEAETLLALVSSKAIPRKLAFQVANELKGIELFQSFIKFAIVRLQGVEETKAKPFEDKLLPLLNQTVRHAPFESDLNFVLNYCAELAGQGHFLPRAPSQNAVFGFVWKEGLEVELQRADGFQPVSDGVLTGDLGRAWTARSNDAAVSLLLNSYIGLPPEEREVLGRVLRGVIRRWSTSFDPENVRALTISTETVLETMARYIQTTDVTSEEKDPLDRKKMMSAYYAIVDKLYQAQEEFTKHQIEYFALPAINALDKIISPGLKVKRRDEDSGSVTQVSFKSLVDQCREALKRRIETPKSAERVVEEVKVGITFQFDPEKGGVPTLEFKRLPGIADNRPNTGD